MGLTYLDSNSSGELNVTAAAAAAQTTTVQYRTLL